MARVMSWALTSTQREDSIAKRARIALVGHTALSVSVLRFTPCPRKSDIKLDGALLTLSLSLPLHRCE